MRTIDFNELEKINFGVLEPLDETFLEYLLSPDKIKRLRIVRQVRLSNSVETKEYITVIFEDIKENDIEIEIDFYNINLDITDKGMSEFKSGYLSYLVGSNIKDKFLIVKKDLIRLKISKCDIEGWLTSLYDFFRNKRNFIEI